jgi:acetyl esterase
VPQIREREISTRLDSRARRIVEALDRDVDFASLAPSVAREFYRESRAPYLWPLDEVAEVVDFPGGDGAPPARLFRSRAKQNHAALPTYIFLHGGGWTVGDLATYEPLCRRLARILPAHILWVDYRLAPEHPYPAPLDDALAACRWLFAKARGLGLDPGQIGVIGDSAGANLAASAALINRDGRLGGRFIAQVLIYPALDLERSEPSHVEFAEGFLLTSALYGWYVDNYLAGHDPRDPRVSPLSAENLTGAAPAVVLHAGFDPLGDEAVAYAGKLKRYGVPVKEIAFADMIHGFLNFGGMLPQADDALACIRSALRSFEATPVNARKSEKIGTDPERRTDDRWK